jgi:hypothetical protein
VPPQRIARDVADAAGDRCGSCLWSLMRPILPDVRVHEKVGGSPGATWRKSSSVRNASSDPPGL